MFRIYLLIAYRNLLKYRAFTLINVLGLSIGIAVSLLIILYLQFSYSIDKFHPNGDNIYRVNTHFFGDTGEETKIGLNTFGGYETLVNEFGEIEQAIKLRPVGSWLSRVDGKSIEIDHVVLSDSNFFDFFGYELLQGNPQGVLTEPNKVVIDEEFAMELFGDQNAIGRTIEVYGSFEMDLEVVGIARSRKNSHLEFKLLVPFSSTMSHGADFISWYKWSVYMYAQVNPNTDITQVQSKVNKFLAEKSPDDRYENHFQSLNNIFLHSSDIKFVDGFNSGNASHLLILTIVGIIILLTAAVNYINISTSKAAQRAKEVGVKKSLGAVHNQLMFQFLGESVMLTTIAGLFALLIADIGLPYFSDLVQANLSLTLSNFSSVLIPMLVLIIGLGLLAGFYPAIVLSSFKPLQVINGKLTASSRGEWGRKMLVGFQFVMTIALIAGTIIIYQQLTFVNSKNLGFDKEQLLVVKATASDKIGKNSQVFRNQINEIPGVISTTRSTDVIGRGVTNNSGGMTVVGKEDKVMTTIFMVDHEYMDTYGLQILEGRDFDRKLASDSTKVIVNEQFVEQLGLQNPIGQTVDFNNFYGKMEIIGVVKDFHFNGLHRKVEPVVLSIARFNLWNITVRYQAESTASVLQSLEEHWKEIEPDVPMEYTFVDDLFDQFYEDDTRLSKGVTVFSLLSILIAAFGLYGLISHTISVKQREIGIRKVLGASVSHIVGIVNRRFIAIHLVAVVLAIPATLWAANYWLDMFAYRIQVSAWPFILSGVLTFIILLFSVLIQTLRAASRNPVEVLKKE